MAPVAPPITSAQFPVRQPQVTQNLLAGFGMVNTMQQQRQKQQQYEAALAMEEAALAKEQTRYDTEQGRKDKAETMADEKWDKDEYEANTKLSTDIFEEAVKKWPLQDPEAAGAAIRGDLPAIEDAYVKIWGGKENIPPDIQANLDKMWGIAGGRPEAAAPPPMPTPGGAAVTQPPQNMLAPPGAGAGAPPPGGNMLAQAPQQAPPPQQPSPLEGALPGLQQFQGTLLKRPAGSLSTIGKLIRDRDALPEGHPDRETYEKQIANLINKDKSPRKVGTRNTIQRGDQTVTQEWDGKKWVDVPGASGPKFKPSDADAVGADEKFNATQMQRMRTSVAKMWGFSEFSKMDEETAAKASATVRKARKYMERDGMDMDEAMGKAYTEIRVKYAATEVPEAKNSKSVRKRAATKIKELIEMGMPPEMVRGVLVGKGWEEEDIVEIMEGVGPTEVPVAPPEAPGGGDVSQMSDEQIMKELGL